MYTYDYYRFLLSLFNRFVSFEYRSLAIISKHVCFPLPGSSSHLFCEYRHTNVVVISFLLILSICSLLLQLLAFLMTRTVQFHFSHPCLGLIRFSFLWLFSTFVIYVLYSQSGLVFLFHIFTLEEYICWRFWLNVLMSVWIQRVFLF